MPTTPNPASPNGKVTLKLYLMAPNVSAKGNFYAKFAAPWGDGYVLSRTPLVPGEQEIEVFRMWGNDKGQIWISTTDKPAALAA